MQQVQNDFSRPRLTNPEPTRNGKMIAIVTLGCGVIALSYLGYHKIFTPSAAALSSKVAAAAKPKQKQSGLSASASQTMTAQITNLITAHPELDISVSVIDLNANQPYHFGESAPFVAASTAKVLTAITYYNQVEQGKMSLSDTVGGTTAQNQMQQMIEESDNGAWEALNSELGHDTLQQYAGANGLTDYDPDNNTLTTPDLATLFAKLYKKQLLNSDHTKQLLGYMKNANKTEYIVAAVPNGTTVYHKAGWLDDRVHDASIINNGSNPYVLVIFSKTKDGSAYDASSGQDFFHQVTNATITAFR